jgi:two-component system nitrogen regulation response regulator NtrX
MAELVVVEDDPDLAELIAGQLEGEGHAVRVAGDGREGLRLVGERQPDLVLLDVEMPFLTGPQMAGQMLLHDLGEEQIPVVLLSGVTNLHQVAARVGTSYFLGKPFDAAALSRLVARALVERRPPMPP